VRSSYHHNLKLYSDDFRGIISKRLVNLNARALKNCSLKGHLNFEANTSTLFFEYSGTWLYVTLENSLKKIRVGKHEKCTGSVLDSKR
jgi:hypothetical protein